jgi:hypothetical protein
MAEIGKKAADWWDGRKAETEDILQQWVNNSDSSVELHSKAVASAALTTIMTVGAGFVDILRIGEGVKKGGFWGYTQDGLRLLSIAGPVAGRAVKLVQLARAKSLADPGGGWCASVAAAKALQQTGTKFFIKAEDVIKKINFAPDDLRQFIPFLKDFGARVTHIALAQVNTFKALEKLVLANPKAVVMFGVRWKKYRYTHMERPAGHALYAFTDRAGKFVIADRTGMVVRSLKELENYYNGITWAEIASDSLIIHNSIILDAPTYLGMLAFQVNAYLTTTELGDEIAITAVQE